MNRELKGRLAAPTAFGNTDGCDGIHFTAENNRDLGVAIADKVKNIL
ncbi:MULTISPECIES: hypothetical protein [Mesorhizobium]|nr:MULTISPECIES: hypothetical protein [Mesorhizobium]